MINRKPSEVVRVLAPDGIFMPNSIGNTGGLFAGLPRMARAMIMGLGSTDVQGVKNWVVNRENLSELAAFLESGDVKVVIDKIYPLAEAGDAVAHMRGHHARGKVAISV